MRGVRLGSLTRGIAAGWFAAAAALPSRWSARRLRVRPLVAYPIARDAVAMSADVGELRRLEGRRVAEPALCLAIANTGREAVTVEEIGLLGWFEEPRLAMREPLFHDGKPWPRTLAPGEAVTAYFAPSLRSHPVLGSLAFAYAQSDRGETWQGSGAALAYFMTLSAVLGERVGSRIRRTA